MGGKHYYCDYCDRSFKDAAGARKKHLMSLQHVRNKESHYKMFKDPKETLAEELAKQPCKRHLNYGDCHFGIHCKYSHYTPAQIQYLQATVAERERAKTERSYPDPNFIVKEFLEPAMDPEDLMEQNQNPWPLPDELKGYENLPPSMRPMTLKDFESIKFAEWGKR